MCITVKRTGVARRNFIGYKIVNIISDGVYKSSVPGIERSRQKGQKSRGKSLTYEDGKVVKSPFKTTAGIYVYLDDSYGYPYSSRVRIKVLIEKGTKIHYDDENYVVCVEKIKVIGIHKNQF